MNTLQKNAWLESGDAELERAWLAVPDAANGWQYMGSELANSGYWEHVFRIRPSIGGPSRYLRVSAPLSWSPTATKAAEVPVAPVARPAVSSPNRPNRYTGTCAACGGGVPAYAGAISKEGGQWKVRHLVCVGKADGGVVAPRERRGVYTRFSSGAEVYRNAKGRCEDAPCCGCCS